MDKSIEKKLESIIQKHWIKSFKIQNSDREDFYDIAIWELKAMLEKAYEEWLKDWKKNNKN